MCPRMCKRGDLPAPVGAPSKFLQEGRFARTIPSGGRPQQISATHLQFRFVCGNRVSFAYIMD